MRKFTLTDGKIRFVFLCLLMGLVFFAILARLVWLQLLHGDEYAQEAQRQARKTLFGGTPRGRIVDRDGAELASSIMTETLIANPKRLTELELEGRQSIVKAAEIIAATLGLNSAQLAENFSDKNDNRNEYYRVKRLLEPQEYLAIKKVLDDHKLEGFYFEEESKRYYVKNNVAAQVLGFVGDDDIGRSGVELQLNDLLHGRSTQNEILQDALGNRFWGDYLIDERREMFVTVYLTLDSKMQYVLEEAMDDAVERTHALGAAAIIMDPATGEILGMASRPTFDPNQYWKYPVNSWNNKAISMIYEPGSVFKPIVGCMGLTEGLITPSTIFNDAGSIRIADRTIHNWDGKGRGEVPFREVIKYSINTGMVQLGMHLGAKRMIDYSEKFGFGHQTGIDLPGEESGILYEAENMWEPDIATMAIGQGIAVTPLQILRAICAIANGGELLQPYIVKKIVNSDGNILREGKKTVVRNVITRQVAEEMRSMMEEVVASGSGRTAAIKGYRIAGKTGTAEKLAEGGGYAEGQYIASFVGFVPADKPRYAMLVMLDTPQGAFYGSQVSAPIFRDTLQQILVAKGVQPSYRQDLPSFEQQDGAKGNKLPPLPQLELLEGGLVKLPDFKGLDIRTTAELLQRGHLRLKPYGTGKAVRQKPEKGMQLAEGSTVEVWFE